ncbi:MAG: hypothetical protein ACRD45_08560 [Bryobacteraceae bacterium]
MTLAITAMRAFVFTIFTLFCTASLFAARKVVSPTTSAANSKVEIQATLTLSEQQVAQKLGIDPGKGIVILHVRIESTSDKPIQVSPDDFILLAHNDGERSKPFEPAEIAGSGAMVLTDKTSIKHSGVLAGFGGMIGGGGVSPGDPKDIHVAAKMDDKAQGNAKLLEILKKKELPRKDTANAVDGYLYFPLKGKHKLKNMAVLYRGSAGRLNLEFKH